MTPKTRPGKVTALPHRGETKVRKSRFTEEQIVGFLKQAEAGMKVKDLCREHGVSQETFYRWRRNHGSLAGRPKAPNDLPQLREIILQALHEVGGIDYLKRIARDEPRVFCSLLARIVPRELEASVKAQQQPVVA